MFRRASARRQWDLFSTGHLQKKYNGEKNFTAKETAITDTLASGSPPGAKSTTQKKILPHIIANISIKTF